MSRIGVQMVRYGRMSGEGIVDEDVVNGRGADMLVDTAHADELKFIQMVLASRL